MEQKMQQGDIFSTLFYTSPDYCSISTLDAGVMLEVNESFARITGWQRDEVVGRSVADFGLWPHPEHRRELVERIRCEGHIHADDIVFRTRSGRLIECTATMFAIEYAAQPCMVAIIRDVSAQRRAEGALKRLARGAGLETRSFFATVVEDLGETLGVEYCMIGSCHHGVLESLATYVAGDSVASFSYEISAGPAQALLQEPMLVLEANARSLYPADSFLAAQGIEAFAGAALRDKQQRVIGMLLAMGSHPFSNPEIVGALLRVFAERAATEMVLERQRQSFIGVQTQLMAELEATRDSFKAKAQELQSMLDASPLAMGVVRERKWLILNRAYEKMFGFSVAESLGQSLELIYPSHEAFLDAGNRIYTAIASGGVSHFEVQYQRKNGEVFWSNSYARLLDVEAPEKGAVIVLEDISERKAAEERIRFLAEHDQLTGLPNRFVLQDRFELERRHAVRDGTSLALLFLDLDRFKLINDQHGHAVGDALLKAVVQRVQACIREIDTLCRQGGDEFVALLPDVRGREEVEAVVARVEAEMRRPFDLDGLQLAISFSIGVALYPDDAGDFQMLLQRADIAMYRAKEGGRNQCCFYSGR